MISNAHAYIIEALTKEQSYKEAINLIKQKVCQDDHCTKSIEKNLNPNMASIDGYSETIKIDQVEAVKDFCSTTSVNGESKIILIQGIENITTKAANTFLKFIEEPDQEILFVFTTMNTESVLETIQTRCQIIRLGHGFEENNQYAQHLIDLNPMEVPWNKLNRNEIKQILISYTRKQKLKNNEKHLDRILHLINMLGSNVNTNLIISQILNELKKGE